MDQSALSDLGERLAGEVAQHPSVHAVLLGGSVARGEAQPSSDVDLLIVSDEQVVPLRRLMHGVLVECISHSEAEWADRFDRAKSSWLYAFIEGRVLVDNGAAARLKMLAGETREHYVASAELRSRLATMLWHSQAKLDRVAADDPYAQSFWSSICIETIFDGLFTIHDVPLPAGARRLAHLDAVGLTAVEQDMLDRYLTGTARHRFEATRELVDHLRARLGPADHESLDGVTL